MISLQFLKISMSRSLRAYFLLLLAATILCFASCSSRVASVSLQELSSRDVYLEDVTPNERISHIFRVVNSTGKGFTVQEVKSPCSCMFRDELVGKIVPSRGTLEVACVFPGINQKADFSIVTDSPISEFRNIKFSCSIKARQYFRAEPSNLTLGTDLNHGCGKLSIIVMDGMVCKVKPSVHTSNGLVDVECCAEGASRFEYNIMINALAPFGESKEFISFEFEDEAKTRLDVATTIIRRE